MTNAIKCRYEKMSFAKIGIIRQNSCKGDIKPKITTKCLRTPRGGHTLFAIRAVQKVRRAIYRPLTPYSRFR